MDDTELPRALIKRIAKSSLTQLQVSEGKSDMKDVQLSKDAILALSESARIFINYLTATGNDICKEAKRQIISIEDVFTALEDLEFAELLPPLKESLEVFKAESKEKSKKRSEQQKRRKLEEAAAATATAGSTAPQDQAAGEKMDQAREIASAAEALNGEGPMSIEKSASIARQQAETPANPGQAAEPAPNNQIAS